MKLLVTLVHLSEPLFRLSGEPTNRLFKPFVLLDKGPVNLIALSCLLFQLFKLVPRLALLLLEGSVHAFHVFLDHVFQLHQSVFDPRTLHVVAPVVE